MGAITVFCLVIVTALPAMLPLALINHPWLALRVSNLLVVGLLSWSAIAGEVCRCQPVGGGFRGS